MRAMVWLGLCISVACVYMYTCDCVHKGLCVVACANVPLESYACGCDCLCDCMQVFERLLAVGCGCAMQRIMDVSMCVWHR